MDTKAAAQKAKRIAIRAGLLAVALVIVGSALFTFFTLHYSYSEGERVGFVQKVSKKGWVCKTNEGELAMANVLGQQAQIFDFTVRGDDVVQQIEALNGHKVALTYEEHRGIPSSCFGETTYFVTAVKKAD
jgi:ABC-type sugar transport system substrate-binding protein